MLIDLESNMYSYYPGDRNEVVLWPVRGIELCPQHLKNFCVNGRPSSIQTDPTGMWVTVYWGSWVEAQFNVSVGYNDPGQPSFLVLVLGSCVLLSRLETIIGRAFDSGKKTLTTSSSEASVKCLESLWWSAVMADMLIFRGKNCIMKSRKILLYLFRFCGARLIKVIHEELIEACLTLLVVHTITTDGGGHQPHHPEFSLTSVLVKLTQWRKWEKKNISISNTVLFTLSVVRLSKL